MNPFEFWPKRFCLTLGGAEWAICQTELKKANCIVEKFDSLPDALGPHQSFNKSFRAMLQKFYDSGVHSCLILEDDVEFRHLDQLWPALQELPADWGVFYLGGNIQGDQPKRITSRIYKVSGMWTTHAVAFTRPIVKYILENQPGFSDEMLDNWLSKQLPKFNAYICKPMVAIQRPRLSRIWGNYTDYRQIFLDSEKKCV